MSSLRSLRDIGPGQGEQRKGLGAVRQDADSRLGEGGECEEEVRVGDVVGVKPHSVEVGEVGERVYYVFLEGFTWSSTLGKAD